MVCEHKIMTKNVCFTVNWLKKRQFWTWTCLSLF